MATLHVRNVPDELYERLKRRADAEGRSLSAEVIMLLDRYMPRQALTPEEQEELFARIDHRREAIKARVGVLPSSVDDIREDRER